MSNCTISNLLGVQSDYEQRFSCMICLSPRLKMVYGSCQHRICDECLYNPNGKRRKEMARCPFCQKVEAFPLDRPEIPEDNIDIQKSLGVQVCSTEGCNAEIWLWEITDHELVCHAKKWSSPVSSNKKCNNREKKLKQKHRSADSMVDTLGPVVYTRRIRRQLQQSASRRLNLRRQRTDLSYR